MILSIGPAEGFVDENTQESVDVTNCKVRFPDREGEFIIREVRDMWDDGRAVHNATQNGSFVFHLYDRQKLELLEQDTF
jgi:hypothetical protein